MIKIVKMKKYGRCLIASKNIKKGTLIEESPLLVINEKKEVNKINQTILEKYVYEYGSGLAIALGLGSLFNHSNNPNVKFVVKKNKILFYTKKDVSKNEQFFINYGYELE